MNNMIKSNKKKRHSALTSSGMFSNNNNQSLSDKDAIDNLFEGFNVELGENLLTDDLLKGLLEAKSISPSDDNVDYFRGLFKKRTEEEKKAMDEIFMASMQNLLK